MNVETLDASAQTLVKTAVPLSTTSYTDANSLYTGLTDSLTTAVDDGSFTEMMTTAAASLGSTSLMNARATGVINSAFLVLTPPPDDDNGKGDDGDDGVDAGVIAGSVIGSVAFVGLVGAGVYYYFYVYSSGNTAAFKADKEIEVDL